MLKKIILLFLISFSWQSNLFSIGARYLSPIEFIHSPNAKCIYCNHELIHPCKYIRSIDDWNKINGDRFVHGYFKAYECSNKECQQTYLFKIDTCDNIKESNEDIEDDNNNIQ